MNIDIARQKMIEQQVRAWDVFDPDVLDVLAGVPRERFVPTGYASLAFADTEIPIGRGESMMTPTIEGRMLQALDLGRRRPRSGGGHRLGIRNGLPRDPHPQRHEHRYPRRFPRTRRLGTGGSRHRQRRVREHGRYARTARGGFDAIAVTGSVQRFDPRFVEALADGGRLFVVVGEAPAMDARVVTRTGDADWESQSLFETDLKPLVHGALPPQFSF